MANRSCIVGAVLLGLLPAGSALADYAYVTNQSSSDLSVIDLDRMVEVERVPVPGAPAGIAVAPKLGAVFTVSPDSKVLRRYGMPVGKPLAERTLDGGPIGVAVDERRGRVFVSDWYNARVWVLAADDLSTSQMLSTGSAPAGLALSPDGQWLATADRDANQVSIFDAQTLELRHRVTVGQRPFGITFSPDGRLFSADVGSNTVTAVDPVNGQVLGHVATRERPYAVAFAGGRGFVTNQYDDSVSVFEAQSLAAIATIDTGEYPEGIDTTADGRRIVVANWFSNSVMVIDPVSLEIVGEISTGDGPRAFGRFLSAAPMPSPGLAEQTGAPALRP
ncbi:beta-propeller fold lactonase family protein [Rhizobium sp. CG5]|uniref:beta-propeller fold lactonase family protein n=1 Tax=Rhizobium sp. CG5 TaxID=2726076 RepID=UPI002033388F|nr:beta-propeller fold lactonase family protein [Rhizobium sp. CG5]